MEVGRVKAEGRHNWSSPIIDDFQSIGKIESQDYAKSVPFTSTIDLILAVAHRYPDSPAMLFQVTADPECDPLSVSYAQLADRILRAGTMLRNAGVVRDTPVALIVPNIPSSHVALWGAQLAGCAFPVNYLLGADHIASLLRTAGAKVVITLGHTNDLPIYATAVEAVRLAGGEITVITIDPDEVVPGPDSFQTLIKAVLPDRSLLQEVNPDTRAAIFHTGGTTGLPKILPLTHRNELHTSCMAGAFYQFSHGDRMLNGFPLFHVAGAFVYGLAALAMGGTIYMPTLLGMRNRDFIAIAWTLFEKHRISHLGCVPTTLASLCQSHERTGRTTSCGVRVALTGGSSLPTEIAAHFESQTGVPIRNIYGMTECSGIVAIEPVAMARTPGSVGLALPYTEVRALPLEDADNPSPTRFCSPGQEGILCLRGPHVSPGYVDESRNAGTFTRNGWLISGDLGFVDQQRRIYITGRSKDLIIRSGHNIDPQVLEEAFLANPNVLDCAAVGQPDSYAGELPVVFLTLREKDVETPAALLAKARPHIPEPPAVPKQVYVLDVMPVTPVGKIFKPELRRLAAREAVVAALNEQGLLDRCNVSFSDTDTPACIVSVVDANTTAQAQRALHGLPVMVEIVVTPGAS